MISEIGFIAEDTSDVQVIRNLIDIIMPDRQFSIRRKFVGHGCGAIRRKCPAWARDLVAKGCSHIVVVHDLDDANHDELRRDLETQLQPVDCAGAVIVIPVRMIEAWLLSDPGAIQATFSLPKPPKVPERPESVRDPKKHLKDLIRRSAKRQYVNTVHNAQISQHLSLDVLRAKCKSFRTLPDSLAAWRAT